MKYRVCTRLLSLALLAILGSGCDIAADVDIGDPINGGPANLDPDDPANIRAYFYAGRPVVGLRYSCARAAAVPITGVTGSDGDFVCPRDRRVSFFVGDPDELKLGEVDLKIFGEIAPGEDNLDSRANVTITPATLVGTDVDGINTAPPDPDDDTPVKKNNRVANIYNLLATFNLVPLDAGSNPLPLDRQDKIVLVDPLRYSEFEPHPQSLHKALSDEDVALLDLETDQASFAGAIAGAVNGMAATIHALPYIELRLAGATLDTGQARNLASTSTLAARAGLYIYTPTIFDIDESGDVTMQGSFGMLVGRLGHTTGLGYYWTTDASNESAVVNEFEHMALQPGTGIAADGTLRDNFTFATAGGDGFTVSGTLVNDVLYSSVGLLDSVTNNKIPHTYDATSEHLGEFVSRDDRFSGKAQLARVPSVELLPDIDLDVIPENTLPAFVRIEYKYYPDGAAATDAQRAEALAAASEPVYPACSGSRYTTCVAAKTIDINILPNGDLVSDLDGDCALASDAGNYYEDADGDREYLVGQAGSAFLQGGVSYLTLFVSVLDPDHPAFGLQIGVQQPFDSPVYLTPMVYDTADGILRNKLCDPEEGVCDQAIEVMNTIGFYEDVFRPVVLASGGPPVDDDDDLFRKPNYFGLVTASLTRCTAP